MNKKVLPLFPYHPFHSHRRGATLTELDTQLLFDEGVTAKGKPLVHHLMNEDLKFYYCHNPSACQSSGNPIAFKVCRGLSDNKQIISAHPEFGVMAYNVSVFP